MSRGYTDKELREMSDMFRNDGSIDPEYVPDFEDCVLPFTRFFHDDFLGGTRGMSPDDGWPYTVMLMEMYSRGAAITLDDDRLSRLCGMSKSKFVRAKNYLIEEGKIVPLEAGLWNEKTEITFILREISKQATKNAGIESGKKRRKNKGRPERTPNAGSTQGEPNSEAQKLSLKEETNVSSKKPPPKRKTSIPENAIITDGMIRAASKRDHGLPEAEAQFSKFKNDALAKGKMFVDWDRAFVTWLDSDYFKPITSNQLNLTGGTHGQPSRTDTELESIARAARAR